MKKQYIYFTFSINIDTVFDIINLMHHFFFVTIYRNFGTFKKKVRTTPMSSLYEVAGVCDGSGDSNFAVLVGCHDGKIQVPTYNWSQHLGTFFRRVPNIKLFHHFRMSDREPGTLYCYRHLNDVSPQQFQLLKKGVMNVPPQLPPVIQPDGLSEERIKYLYDEIREFCSDETKDLVAPAPKN